MKKLLLLILILVSCAPITPFNGYVISKEETPAWDESTNYYHSCYWDIMEGKSKCGYKLHITPKIIHHPAEYRVTAINSSGCSGVFRVSKEEYDALEINDDFTSTTHNPCQK